MPDGPHGSDLPGAQPGAPPPPSGQGASRPPEPPGAPSASGAPASEWSPTPTRTGVPPSKPAAGPAGDPSPKPTPRRPIGLALVLIGVGVVWLLALAGVSLPWELLLPLALVAIGVLVLLSPLWGGGGGLVGLGIVLAVVALVVAVPGSDALSAGDRAYAVTTVDDLQDRYGLGAGTMTLDLRELELPPGTTEVVAGVNLGELVVLVPADVTVTGEGRVFLGEIEHFERTSGGVAPRAAISEPGTDADRVLDLRLRVGLGQIEVSR